MFPEGEDEIGSAPKDDGVEYIDTGSKRMKGPPKKRSQKFQLKNARAQANEINRLAQDKYDDLRRMKDGKEKDRRNEELMNSGKEMHFLEPAAGEPRAPSKEITLAQIN